MYDKENWCPHVQVKIIYTIEIRWTCELELSPYYYVKKSLFPSPAPFRCLKNTEDRPSVAASGQLQHYSFVQLNEQNEQTT